ncbi:adenylate kinase family protein [Halococcus saccharolyticus]|uniref:Putative adenylate kinase n=1 Tax=Halococcus saccharolyticus DSM 5350 TaxID=1227455 RepID=M0MRB8_9EURY|nr:adenylate kinase family protein [Halococcus saccharolyticus]EMA47289.1 nucleotide kinase [Halococcus saccharolyticus DSM 5350]
MRVAVTGTPGSGKTTATDRLAARDDGSNADDSGGVEGTLDLVHLNEVIREEGLSTGTDADRDSLVADLDGVEAWLDDRQTTADIALVESHLAHWLNADRVVVLRCHPAELEDRLAARGEPDATITENAESEALDVILGEAVERHSRDAVYEIDATDRAPEDVASEIRAVIAGEREPSAGTVSFVEYL